MLVTSVVFAGENSLWQDLQQVFQINVQTKDQDFRPSISRIRKLFYDGFRWNMLIPEASGYTKPTDALSLSFKRKYQGDILIEGQREDFKHMLAVLDAYLHPVTVNFGIGNHKQPYANYDLASWLGDIASALVEAYKQQIPLETALARYASYEDMKANIAGYHISLLAKAYTTTPIVEFPVSRNLLYPLPKMA